MKRRWKRRKKDILEIEQQKRNKSERDIKKRDINSTNSQEHKSETNIEERVKG